MKMLEIIKIHWKLELPSHAYLVVLLTMELAVVLPLICFSSISDNEDDGALEFRKCIRVLADRVGMLSRLREELLDKYPKVEAVNEQLRKELEEKKELVKTLYTKHRLEKQVTFYFDWNFFLNSF